MTTAALLFARATARAVASDYVEWAGAMLEQNHDSRSLRILAGLKSESVFEVDDYFRRVSRELQLPEPSFDTCLQAYACELATQIVDGALEPKAGVRQLYRLCIAAEYSSALMAWYYLDDGLDDIEAGQYPATYPSLTPDNAGETIVTEALRFLEACCSSNSPLP